MKLKEKNNMITTNYFPSNILKNVFDFQIIVKNIFDAEDHCKTYEHECVKTHGGFECEMVNYGLIPIIFSIMAYVCLRIIL